MTDTNTDCSTADSAVILSENSSTSVLPSSSPPTSSTKDDAETKRRKILSKLWGKGNKSSQKVRELEKSTINNCSDSSIHNDNDQQQLAENSDNLSSYSSTNDPKSATEDSSNSMNSSKPLAVVKPIVMVKSGLIVSPALDRTRVNSEASSTTNTQIDETTTSVTERQSSSSTTTTTTAKSKEKSSKKKKSHKNDESKKKKSTRDKSHERDRSKDRHHHHHHHQQQIDENSSKKSSSSSKNHRREHNEETSNDDNHHKSSRYHSSSTTSLPSNKRRSPSNDNDHSNRKSSRSTTSRKDEPSSSKRSARSPVDDHRHSNRHHRGSSRTLSPSPSRSRHTTTNRDRSPTKHSSSPKKEDRSTAPTTKSNRPPTELVSNSKSTNSSSPTDSYSNHRLHGSDTMGDSDTHRHKTRTNDENLTTSSKSQKSHDSSPPPHHHSSSSSSKQEKSKTTTNHEENSSSRRKLSSSQHDRRSHSRHRSRSKEDKTNRKPTESSNVEDNSSHKSKTNHDKESTTVHENSHNDKKSSRDSSIPSTTNEHRRKSSSEYHRYDRHDSPSNYDRRNDYYYHHHHSRHSHYPSTHYVHHHHHHHYRSTSSRYHHHHRSPSPRSHQHRSRYFSSSSSSLSPSPRRRSPSRTSSSSSRTSSSYSSISRTSSSRSSSRNHHYYHRHHERKYRRSPTLEKLFLKASESIESVSTQKNPNQSTSTTHLIPILPPNTDLSLPSTMNSLSETNAYYAERFSGFSAPPPPFMSQPQQRYLKEITTDSATSHRLMFNELPPSATSSMIDEVIPMKTIQSNDLSTNVRSGTTKPPRVSRFSDITPTVPSEPALNTNLPVDTPVNYAQISDNINCLPSSRRQQKHHNREVMECECTTSEYDRSRGIKACGHECLNRMLLIECSSNCPCGQWCTNRRFQRRSFASHKLALFKTEMKGYGLRTVSTIRKGRFLVEYVGEVIDMDELVRRNKKYKRDGNIHQYVMSLIHGTVIDSTIKGNWARFINHSCEPNCVAEKWLVNGEYRMGIFAKRDLDANEEITIDYRFETFGSADLASEKCYCGAPTCRGTISIKSNNNNNNANKRQNRRQAIDDDELLDYLYEDDTNEFVIPKTIDEIRQLIQIMSRTDSEKVRTIELDLIRNASQKHSELSRLFLECNGLHVLCSWMKDILIIDDEQQQYSDEFKHHLLDFIETVLPIKDRTTVVKNGLLDLVCQKIKLPSSTTDNIGSTDQEQIQNLMNSILNHLDDPIITKLFRIHSTWMSLKERYIIPKRKEPQEPSDHHYHHRHHHHSSKHSYEESSYRSSFNTRSSMTQPKPIDRYSGRRSYIVRDLPRTQEQQLSKDERRKLFEQQYEDEEKARAAAAAVAANGESPGGQNEPPHKKQRTSDGMDPTASNTPPQTQSSSTPYQNQMDQTYMIYQHLSQIPLDYIRSYLISIGQPIPESSASTGKDEPPVPPPPRPDDEAELSRIIHLPTGWSVTMYPSDSSVYFYNQETMTSSWIPPTENPSGPLDLSPLSSAQITEQRRPHHHRHHLQQPSSSAHSALKLSKHPHRHSRNHRHHHPHYLTMSSNKRKRPTEMESTAAVKEEPHLQSAQETSMITANEQINNEGDEFNDKKPAESMEDTSSTVPKAESEDHETDMSTTVKESSETNNHIDEQTSSHENNLSSSFKINRDLLRKNISQHVHTTLKPYTKRTCKQGRIVSTDDIKYLVKKFTLAVLDKEIEKAKNEGIPLAPVLTERVRLKTEVYVKKYMNKMGSVFQRHETNVHATSQTSQPPPPTTTTATSNSE